MSDELASNDTAARAVRALGRDIRITSGQLAGSASGSGVQRVRVDGRDAVLKVTGVDGERDRARRELAFYRTLADQVPIRTPALLGYVDDTDVTALLLAAHRPAPPAREWDRSAWLAAAGQLAELHAFRVPNDAPWVVRSWLRGVVEQPPLGIAADFWGRTAAASRAHDVLGSVAALGQALDATPDGFVHGDCHADNILLDGSELVWADWQEAGIGKPATDLAFLWSRAHADRAEVPYDAMLRAYTGRSGVEAAPLQRALIAAELGTLLFGWPMHARSYPPHERDRLTRRLIQLVDDWHRVAG